jgi:phage-related minor tail protein
MNPRIRGPVAAFLCFIVLAAVAVSAQTGDKYTARLSPVPVANANERNNVTGKGMATATLAGTRLTINGSFEGLPATATMAKLHQGIAKGARGKPIADLTVSKGTTGTLSGSVTLTPDQLEALKQGKLYVQVFSEKGINPEQAKAQPDVDHSNLWGWLLR